MENNLILVVIIITYLIGSKFFKSYNSRIKGKQGENRISILLRKLDKTQYLTLNDLNLKFDERTTQIDHIIISIYGVFVIETKNYKGWIHGNEKSENWTQTIYKKKIKFRNPIKQNWAHVFLLKSILRNFNQINYFPIVVFTGNVELKNIYSKIPVIYENRLLQTIKDRKRIILSSSEVESITSQIRGYITKGKVFKKEHRKFIQKSINYRNQKLKSLNCPKCNGQLKVRKGPHGKFYGCSNFPGCKFSTKY